MTDGSHWGPPPPAGSGEPAQPYYGQTQYEQPQYGHPQYGHPQYDQPPPGYPPPGYGQVPYGQFSYGAPAWPARRPSVVTAAGVLGIVTGGLTALGSLIMLLVAARGEDVATVLLTLGLPCAVGLVAGGVRVLQGRAARLLFASALAAVGVLLAALVAGLLTLGEDGRIGLTAFVVFAAVLPSVTAVFARLRQVTAWAEG